MKYKVLIIEDEKTQAEHLAASLGQVGLQTKVLNRGDQAVSIIKGWAPHVVILDLELPGKSGPEILREMLKDPTLKETIVIANSIHMGLNDNLGFSFFAQYKLNKNKEPIMVDKLNRYNIENQDLRHILANVIGQKYGEIPIGLAKWVALDRKP